MVIPYNDPTGRPPYSMWDYDSGKPKWPRPKGSGWPHWPKDTLQGPKSIEVVACEGELLVSVEMFRAGFGNWAFTTFFPSPTEIARKWILGGYACGFYLTGKQKSPLDIIWRNGELTKFLAKLAIGPTSALFVMWGQDAIMSGLAQWQSMLYAADMCDADNNEMIAHDAQNTWPNGPFEGIVAIYVVTWNPKGYMADPSGVVTVPPGYSWTAQAFGQFRCFSGYLHDLEVGIRDANTGIIHDHQYLGDLSPGGEASFSVGPAAGTGPAVLGVWVKGENLDAPAAANIVQVQTWTAYAGPSAPERPCYDLATAMLRWGGIDSATIA